MQSYGNGDRDGNKGHHNEWLLPYVMVTSDHHTIITASTHCFSKMPTPTRLYNTIHNSAQTNKLKKVCISDLACSL